MAGGGAVAVGPATRADKYNGIVTWTVLLTVFVAACGGAMFGYDNGITGGVTSMPSWQLKFFPDVYSAQTTASPYCKYDNQLLQLFTSSMYLAAMASSLVASYFTSKFGRKVMMIVAGAFFIIGTILQAAAQDIAMLIIGRVILGVGVGFANQCVPVYLSEVAPVAWRGACNMAFQLAVTCAILAASIINWKTSQYSQTENGQGWRFSLGFAVVPGVVLFLGSFFLPESPSSLIEHGQLDKAHTVLQHIRGVENVDAEFDDLTEAATAAALITNQWAAIVRPRYRPHVVICILVNFFQQLTGINCVMFYAPQIFSMMGHSLEQSLVNTIIINAVNVIATIIAIILVDRVGRRALYLEGGLQMLVGLIVMGTVIGVKFANSPDGSSMSDSASKGVVTAACFFIAAFAWSWGPMGYLTPAEILPPEVRSPGMSVAICTNLLFTFFIGQAFLSMMCGMQFGVYYFFASFVVLMTIFVFFFIPETSGVPNKEIQQVFAAHKLWSRITGHADMVVDEPNNIEIDVKQASIQQV